VLPPISILKLIDNTERGEILPNVPTVNSISIPVLIIFLSDFLSQASKYNPAERAVALTGSLNPLYFYNFNLFHS
jgi:alanine-alpha-ketoisovalerate/valine-pyruvate aminotransferase